MKKEIKIILLLVLMILLSFFSGISINQQWSFVYQYEFIDFPEIMNKYDLSPRELPAWILVLLSHLGILFLPFSIRLSSFRKLLIWFPLGFLAGYVILQLTIVFLLLPFIIVWVITLRKSKTLT